MELTDIFLRKPVIIHIFYIFCVNVQLLLPTLSDQQIVYVFGAVVHYLSCWPGLQNT